MKEFIIGRTGNQPFKIVAKGVSSEHARITIDDSGLWMLEDLRGTAGNGTYIRDDNGNFTQVLKTPITEQTIIRLASFSDFGHNSFTFMAHHVLVTDPNDYSYELNCVYQLREKLKLQESAIDESIIKSRYYSIIAPIAGFFISCVPPFNSSMMTVRLAMVIPPVIISIRNFKLQGKMKELMKIRKSTIVCPKCGVSMSDYDVDNRQCSRCKAQ